MLKYKVFVSYSHREANWVKDIAKALVDQGVQVWLDQFEVKAGEPIRGESDLFVVLIDPNSIRTPSLLFELGAAIGMGKRVVAIVPKDFDPDDLPLPLRARRFLVKGSPDATAGELVALEGQLNPEA